RCPELDCTLVKGTTCGPPITEEVRARRRDTGSRCCSGIDGRHGPRRWHVASEHCAAAVVTVRSPCRRWVGQRQRTPGNVDPVVALVHCGSRGQVKGWLRNRGFRDARGPLVAGSRAAGSQIADRRILRRNPGAVAVLLGYARG